MIMGLLVTLPYRRLFWSLLCCFTVASAMEPSRMRGLMQESSWSQPGSRSSYLGRREGQWGRLADASPLKPRRRGAWNFSTDTRRPELTANAEAIHLIGASHDDIYEYILARAMRNFYRTYEEKKIPLGLLHLPHKTYPFGLVLDGHPGSPSSVLRAGHGTRLNGDEWTELYAELITTLSKKYHEEIKASLPTDLYKQEQTKLADWLHKQIFDPDHGRPLLGTSRNSFTMEPIRDVQVGDDQVQLINYFSQALVNQHNPILEPTVTKLLESYKLQRSLE
ncbi:hypothetical protein PGT21_024325 [Puccinia graminis f. sp. tritici]|uniref:Uncharacterized protein n=1 Tax=Puccinia graminis f. sp. tritici TaxID=56615 RepID=A0A5B0M0Z5_PUCGR|nr:hypothetical protein PGT21_024325 [Puccinia graminis f. sp. tritici]